VLDISAAVTVSQLRDVSQWLLQVSPYSVCNVHGRPACDTQ